MENKTAMNKIDLLLEEMIQYQKKKMYKIAKRISPNITEDDLLQPFDFPDLELNADFRYEEGLLHGTQTAQAAIRRFLNEESDRSKR